MIEMNRPIYNLERVQVAGSIISTSPLNALFSFQQSPLKSVRFSGLSSRPSTYCKRDSQFAYRSGYSVVERLKDLTMLTNYMIVKESTPVARLHLYEEGQASGNTRQVVNYLESSSLMSCRSVRPVWVRILKDME